MPNPIDLDQLTPEQQEELLGQLQSRRAREVAETKARMDLDRVLRKKLADQGIQEGDEWVKPTHYECAYPSSWVVKHGGVEWISTLTGAFGEPGEGDDWTLVYGEGEEPEPDEDES